LTKFLRFWDLQGVDPTKLFFRHFFFFRVKLGHFTINNFFSVCNKNASLPAKKWRNSLLVKKKNLVGSTPALVKVSNKHVGEIDPWWEGKKSWTKL